MHSSQRPLRPVIVFSLATLLLGATGCGRFKQQVKTSMDNDPKMRQTAIDSARNSCVQTATAKAPHLPGMEAKIGRYCDCFATKGLGKFSNSELASIAMHGDHFTQDQQAKLMQGVELCQGEISGKER